MDSDEKHGSDDKKVTWKHNVEQWKKLPRVGKVSIIVIVLIVIGGIGALFGAGGDDTTSSTATSTDASMPTSASQTSKATKTSASPTSKATATKTITTSSSTPDGYPTISTGLDSYDAETACINHGDKVFPYGFNPNYLFHGGVKQRIIDDRWYTDFTAKVKNEYGAQRTSRIQCTATGTTGNPRVTAFLVDGTRY